VAPECDPFCAALLAVPDWDVFLTLDWSRATVEARTVADGAARWVYRRSGVVDAATVDAEAGRVLVTRHDAAVVLALEDGRELATTNLPGETCVDAALTDQQSDGATQLRAGSFTALACGDQMRADSSRPTAPEVVLVEVASGDILAKSDLPNEVGTCQVWPVATAIPTVVRWGQDCGPPALLAADGPGGLDEAEMAPPTGSTPNCSAPGTSPCVETIVIGLRWDTEDDAGVRELVAVGTDGEIRWRTERSAWRPLVTRYGIVVRARDWALLSP
jgi:hypothetical protein